MAFHEIKLDALGDAGQREVFALDVLRGYVHALTVNDEDGGVWDRHNRNLRSVKQVVGVLCDVYDNAHGVHVTTRSLDSRERRNTYVNAAIEGVTWEIADHYMRTKHRR